MEPIVSVAVVTSLIIGALIAFIAFNTYFRNRKSELVSISNPADTAPSNPNNQSKPLHSHADKDLNKRHHPLDLNTLKGHGDSVNGLCFSSDGHSLATVQKDTEKGSVCVTGGTGFLGSWMIKRLLEEGYYVNTTVRFNTDVSCLNYLPRASERLKIFEADLKNPKTFDAPIKGCVGVFHVAHPIDFEGKESEEMQIETAIKGSLGILQACVDSKTVKKFVYTSSGSAVVFNGKKHTEVLDEESWSDTDFIHAHFNEFVAPYFISKTMTEKATLKFGKENGLDVVTIIPTFIHGPFIVPRCPGSVHDSMAMIFGDTANYDILIKIDFVHVDDVVRAHVHLLEYPHAEGRYICSKVGVTFNELHELLSSRYPEYKMPNIDLFKDVEKMKAPGVSSRKLLSTGFQFNYGLEEMFDDAINCCKQHNIL